MVEGGDIPLYKPCMTIPHIGVKARYQSEKVQDWAGQHGLHNVQCKFVWQVIFVVGVFVKNDCSQLVSH